MMPLLSVVSTSASSMMLAKRNMQRNKDWQTYNTIIMFYFLVLKLTWLFRGGRSCCVVVAAAVAGVSSLVVDCEEEGQEAIGYGVQLLYAGVL